MGIQFQQKERYDVQDLLRIMEILRSENGCPWDREQTHESIRRDFVEEVYEALEAIDLRDTALLREELGDVLLQVVFHARIEEEAGRFCFADVTDEVCKKLIVRHPHIFSDVVANTSEEVLRNWDKIKQQSKGQTAVWETMDSVAKSLPALMYAEKVLKRAERGGALASDAQTALEALSRQTKEILAQEAVHTSSDREEQLGQILLQVVSLSRSWGIDPEESLVKAAKKLTRDYQQAEEKGCGQPRLSSLIGFEREEE